MHSKRKINIFLLFHPIYTKGNLGKTCALFLSETFNYLDDDLCGQVILNEHDDDDDDEHDDDRRDRGVFHALHHLHYPHLIQRWKNTTSS